MSVEELKALARRWFEEMNKGKAALFAAMDQTYDPNIVIHGLELHGLKNVKQWWNEPYSAFPDLEITFDDRIVKGDKVVTRFTEKKNPCQTFEKLNSEGARYA